MTEAPTTTDALNILVIEDNSDDILLMKLALKEFKTTTTIKIITDGEKAINLVNNYKEKNDSFPSLIFLDINLPVLNGIEVLKEIKRNDLLCKVPVVIFTSSDDPNDMKKCYEKEADLYVRKPNNITEYRIIMGQIKEHFFGTI